LRCMGIRGRPAAPASPLQNGVAERLIGSIQHGCVDYIIVLGEVRLRRILKSYASYYNEIRTHRSLDKDAPIPSPNSANRNHQIVRHSSDFATATPELEFSIHTTFGGVLRPQCSA